MATVAASETPAGSNGAVESRRSKMNAAVELIANGAQLQKPGGGGGGVSTLASSDVLPASSPPAPASSAPPSGAPPSLQFGGGGGGDGGVLAKQRHQLSRAGNRQTGIERSHTSPSSVPATQSGVPTGMI